MRPPMKSKSENIKVFLGSNPTAIMSFTLSRVNPFYVFHSQGRFVKVFFVVRHLDHQGDVKDFMKPPRKSILEAIAAATYKVNPNGTI